jgi:hypothetical protein
MEALAQHSVPSRNWPPESGWPLFFAWMGAVLAARAVNGIIASIITPLPIPSQYDWKVHVLAAIAPVAAQVWQAWLLFRKYPTRFAMWTALPLIIRGFFAVVPVIDKMAFILFMTFVPLIETALLRGVRLRPWAWFVASMAGLGLSLFVMEMMQNRNVVRMIDSLLTGAFGAKSGTWPKLAKSQFDGGIWLLIPVVAAAVLAWKMPPVIPRPRSTNPN